MSPKCIGIPNCAGPIASTYCDHYSEPWCTAPQGPMPKKLCDMSGVSTVIPAVRCESCGELHPMNSDAFLTFYGNVAIGSHGHAIGNNIAEGKVVKSSIYCRNAKCLDFFLRLIPTVAK